MTEDIETLRGDLDRVIAEAVRLKEELRVAADEIEQARNAASNTALLSQQLRTPLNTIIGFSQLLKTRTRGQDEHVEQILNAGCQLLEIIEKLIPSEDLHSGAEGGLEILLPQRSEPMPDAPVNILYVEDNLMNFSLIQQILTQRPKLKLISSTYGQTAVPLAREHQPALVLLDLDLPDMHGTEVLKRLRAEPATRHVPVVVISADATPSQIERLLANGARNYVTKPFDIKRFLCTVDEIVTEQIKARRK